MHKFIFLLPGLFKFMTPDSVKGLVNLLSQVVAVNADFGAGKWKRRPEMGPILAESQSHGPGMDGGN